MIPPMFAGKPASTTHGVSMTWKSPRYSCNGRMVRQTLQRQSRFKQELTSELRRGYHCCALSIHNSLKVLSYAYFSRSSSFTYIDYMAFILYVQGIKVNEILRFLPMLIKSEWGTAEPVPHSQKFISISEKRKSCRCLFRNSKRSVPDK